MLVHAAARVEGPLLQVWPPRSTWSRSNQASEHGRHRGSHSGPEPVQSEPSAHASTSQNPLSSPPPRASRGCASLLTQRPAAPPPCLQVSTEAAEPSPTGLPGGPWPPRRLCKLMCAAVGPPECDAPPRLAGRSTGVRGLQLTAPPIRLPALGGSPDDVGPSRTPRARAEGVGPVDWDTYSAAARHWEGAAPLNFWCRTTQLLNGKCNVHNGHRNMLLGDNDTYSTPNGPYEYASCGRGREDPVRSAY